MVFDVVDYGVGGFGGGLVRFGVVIEYRVYDGVFVCLFILDYIGNGECGFIEKCFYVRFYGVFFVVK